MEQIKTKVKKWGNSFGIVIPKEIINNEKIMENSNVAITIEPENRSTVNDILKLARKNKSSKINVKKILGEIDRDFEG